MTFRRCRRRPLVAALALAAVAGPAAPARADVVDLAFVRGAAEITRAVRGLNADRVAVLKFEVQVGDKPATFDAGLANVKLAQKLENLLVLANDPENPLLVLTGAAARAAELPGAPTWRDPDGRAGLAGIRGLPLAWDGRQKLTPDAFVTGRLKVAADLRSAKVELYGFTRANPRAELQPLYATPDRDPGADRAAVPTDRSLLALVGVSYAVDRTAASRTDADRDAVQQAVARLGQPASFAKVLDLSPVKLEVFVNDRPVAPGADPDHPGGGRLGPTAAPALKKGDAIYFRLKNCGTRRYAVLLAVNGKNTNCLGRDPELNARDPKDQRKWVLDPEQAVTIRGFYTDAKEGAGAKFHILGEEASAAAFPLMSERYRGLITMHVFAERAEPAASAPQSTPEPEAARRSDAEPEMVTLGVSGTALEEVRTAGDPVTARERLQGLASVRQVGDGRYAVDPARAAGPGRGLIAKSDTRIADGPIETVPFRLDPSPVAFVQIRYYDR